MPVQIFPMSVQGGFNTEAGPSAPFQQNPDGSVIVPWLINAENCVYALDGWPMKMPGASNVNSSATGASDHVNGIFDYWKSGTSGAPTQQRIVYAGTAYYRESGGTLTSIATGHEAAKMPWFEVMGDDLVGATTSDVDVPWAWDQTTFANLGGTPPNFAFHVVHKARMFAAGVTAAKSRLYYSAQSDHEDWTGAGSGSVDVAADDGDVITGIRSHKGELIIFKGPHKGAIYRLSGSSPSDFALSPFVKRVGATNHQAIIERAGDLLFWDHFGIHSLEATANYGDYEPAYLSAPVASYFTKLLNHGRFEFVWGVPFISAGYALWTATKTGSTANDVIIGLDLRFSPPRFFTWPAFGVASLAMVLDASQETVPWAGTYTGRALRMNQTARDIAGSGYTYKATLPYLNFGDPFFDKTLSEGRISITPKGETTFTVAYQRDGQTQQSVDVDQSGTATLAPSSDQFVLDTDALGGGRYVPRFFEMTGSFKELQIELTKNGIDEDFEPHSMAIEVESAGRATTEPVG